jgi:hypothetical protein
MKFPDLSWFDELAEIVWAAALAFIVGVVIYYGYSAIAGLLSVIPA